MTSATLRFHVCSDFSPLQTSIEARYLAWFLLLPGYFKRLQGQIDLSISDQMVFRSSMGKRQWAHWSGGRKVVSPVTVNMINLSDLVFSRSRGLIPLQSLSLLDDDFLSHISVPTYFLGNYENEVGLNWRWRWEPSAGTDFMIIQRRLLGSSMSDQIII